MQLTQTWLVFHVGYSKNLFFTTPPCVTELSASFIDEMKKKTRWINSSTWESLHSHTSLHGIKSIWFHTKFSSLVLLLDASLFFLHLINYSWTYFYSTTIKDFLICTVEWTNCREARRNIKILLITVTTRSEKLSRSVFLLFPFHVPFQSLVAFDMIFLIMF